LDNVEKQIETSARLAAEWLQFESSNKGRASQQEAHGLADWYGRVRKRDGGL
jgi:hypothetical protein